MAAAAAEVEMKVMKNDVRGWADLPHYIQELIFSHLFGGDCIRFRLTCKSWQSVNNIPILLLLHSNILPQSQSQSQYSYSEWRKIPWLMYFSKKVSIGEFKFFHPVSNETYVMEIPELAGAMFRASKYGWLLMSRGNRSLFFFNPFSSTKSNTITLTDLPENLTWVSSYLFTAPPTSPDCKIFLYATGNRIFKCVRVNDDAWSSWSVADGFPYEPPFLPSICPPVLHKGTLYYISPQGTLGCLMNIENHRTLAWKVMLLKTKLAGILLPDDPDDHDLYVNYIAEYDGELVSVFVGFFKSGNHPVHVFKWDWSESEWVEMESLGNKTMFVTKTASLLLPAMANGMENKIYFGRFVSKQGCCGGEYRVKGKFDLSEGKGSTRGVYYCLRTRRYHSNFETDFFRRENWIGTAEVPHCTWIQPA